MGDRALKQFKASANIRGGRVDLTWTDTWAAQAEQPLIRLLRRRRAYPKNLDDGLCLFDMTELFREPYAPWPRIERTVYLVPNRLAGSSLKQAEVVLFFAQDSSSEPARIEVGYYDAEGKEFHEEEPIVEVTRVIKEQSVQPPWTKVVTLDIFAAAGGQTEQWVGRVAVYTGHSDGTTPNLFEWIALDPSAPPTASVDFDRIDVQTTTADLKEFTDHRFQMEVKTVQDDIELRKLQLSKWADRDSGNHGRHISVQDMELETEVVWYYRLFVYDEETEEFLTDRAWRASATPTDRYGLDERLYQLLPAIHKQYDEPMPGEDGDGQLRRFLSIFGVTLDHLRSLAECLRDRHDVHEVHAQRLPLLAQYIGWDLDRTLDELSQRNEIAFAPEIYKTIGTIPNIRALINRFVGWDCRVKEFAHNVFLTNAPESIRLWEIYEMRIGDPDDTPKQVTHTDGFDGRPVAVVSDQATGWLVWHRDLNGRRRIWLQRLDAEEPAPRCAALDANKDQKSSAYSDECPALVADGDKVRLFWSSNRNGSWDIWHTSDGWPQPFGRSLDGTPTCSPPENITQHHAEDRHPTAIVDADGKIRVFWQSNRRGPTDIWMRAGVRQGDGVIDWEDAERVTTALFRHEQPAAVVDGSNSIWLFYSDDLGDRRNVCYTIYENGVWSTPAQATEGPHRDESPYAILSGGGFVSLYWHSNRNGHWQVWWAQSNSNNGWTHASEPLTWEATADKEPSIICDQKNRLRLFWRSQRRGRNYQSRTIDTADEEMVAFLGSFKDRAHYTYDTGKMSDDWYARETAGLYIIPDVDDERLITQKQASLEILLSHFLPVQVRPVFIIPLATQETVYTYDFPDIHPERLIKDAYSDDISRLIYEIWTHVSDSHVDAVPAWVRMLSVLIDGVPPGVHNLDHRTVDFAASPIVTKYRTWHTGLEYGD